MCGIVGIYHRNANNNVDRALLQKMNDVQTHRGPDGEGIHVEDGLGLGHRRLSIIDIDGGAQPMANDDGDVVIVYNGEVYNFPELKKELEAQGHRFHSRCDTEVILHSYMAWGAGCVEKLRGMFAFAIWDRKNQSLFLARDRLGIKPLYYCYENERLMFASELKSLLQDPNLPRDIDPKAVEDYFTFGYVPDPKTIFHSVRKLPPGYILQIDRNSSEPRVTQYWDVSFSSSKQGSEAEIGEELISRLRDAVDVRMISDVPLGAFLSGGVDSSAVVAMMAGLSSDPVSTCSISFGDKRYNESEFAREVANRYKTNHHVEQVDPDAYDLIDKLANLYDEPYADSSAMPTYRVCQLARKHVTVALSGDGGDENLAGYRRHRWAHHEDQVRDMFPSWFRRPVFGALGKYYPKMDWAPKIFRAKSTFESLARDSMEGYLHTVSVTPDTWRKQLFNDHFKNELQGYDSIEVFKEVTKNAPVDHPLSLVQYLDLKTYLPGDILTKVDRASMAHSLEVRVPILDHPLVEWLATVDAGMKLKGREGKYIFKKSLEPHLPESILYRPKMGFAVPLEHWFREPLKERVKESLLGPVLAETGIFNEEYLKHVVEAHQSGIRNYTAMIWALLMFDAFLRQVMGR